MDDLKVDEALAGIVHPDGFWQFIVVILTALSIPGTAIISVFTNSSPKYRCRLEPQIEAWLLNASSTSNATRWDIRSVAEFFGPKLSHPTAVRACEVYAVDRLQNATIEKLFLYQSQTLPLVRDKCPFGFVYEYDWYQFPGGLVEEWDLVCDRAWEVPFNESIYMLGMLIGYLVGGWFSDRFGRRLVILASESPKWLVARARYRDAGDVLYRGYRMNAYVRNLFASVSKRSPLVSRKEFFALIGVPDESVKDKSAEQDIVRSGHFARRAGKFTVFQLFNRTMVATTLLCTILIAGHLTCVFGIAFYSANIRLYTSYVLMINAVASIPGSLLFAGLYRCFRFRKRPLMVIYLVTAAVLWIASLYTIILQPKNDIALNVLMAVVTMMLTTGSKMVFVYVPELYSPVYRNRGLGVCAGLARVGVFWFPLINRLDSSVKHGFPLTIYAGIITLQMVILCFLRDTNGEASVTARESNCEIKNSQWTESPESSKECKPLAATS
ncbi:unnamed protein product [Dibothriocephalus latus]|uniref:Major facilitator superfamily (MFS) profile domain-containing protein n=1 Tax=Dibothriocephalus latus TaxID=60516 RepID=A0A3P7M313_DIBLA|nr:unnamed protein product [Dibothriocephalus latus]